MASNPVTTMHSFNPVFSAPFPSSRSFCVALHFASSGGSVGGAREGLGICQSWDGEVPTRKQVFLTANSP